jgi:hypothetical protein
MQREERASIQAVAQIPRNLHRRPLSQEEALRLPQVKHLTSNIFSPIKYLISLKVINIYHVL